jgi:hypothetical protein
MTICFALLKKVHIFTANLFEINVFIECLTDLSALLTKKRSINFNKSNEVAVMFQSA